MQRFWKQKTSRFFWTLAVPVVLLGVFVLPLVARASVIVSSDEVRFSLTTAKQDEGFELTSTLLAPQALAVGDSISFGPRNVQTVEGITMALWQGTLADCSGGVWKVCPGSYALPSVREDVNAQQGLHAFLDPKKLSGWENVQPAELYVAAAVVTASGVRIDSGSARPLLGEVLQSTTTCDKNKALTVTATPTSVKVGDNITFNYKVTDACKDVLEGPGSSPNLLKIALYHGLCAGNCSDAAYIAEGAYSTGSRSVQITPNAYSLGEKAVTVMAYLTVAGDRGGSAADFKYYGTVTFTVTEGAGSGTLKVKDAKTDVGSGTVTKTFTVFYDKAAGGPEAAGLEIKCNAEAAAMRKKLDLGATEFDCTYSREAGDYKISIQGLDSSGAVVAGVSTIYDLKITGNEVPILSGTVTAGEASKPAEIFDFINTILSAIFQFIQSLIYWLFVGLVLPFLKSILKVRTYTSEFSDVIWPAHIIIRRVANIAFILAIVAMGVGTIFRAGSWTYKNMFVNLVIGAVMVNFSLILPQAVLGVADTLQNQFLPTNSNKIEYLATVLMGANQEQARRIVSGDAVTFGTVTVQGNFSETVSIVVRLIMAIIAFFTFVAVTFYMFFRLVGLWLLLLIAPLPWVTRIFPGAGNMGVSLGKWWGNFMGFAFMGAIVGFMLNLSAIVARAVLETQGGFFKSLSNPNTGSNIGDAAASIAGSFVVIGFMLAALSMARKVKSTGITVVDNIAKKGMQGALWPQKQLMRGVDKAKKATKEYGKEKWQANVSKPIQEMNNARLKTLAKKEADAAAGVGPKVGWLEKKARTFGTGAWSASTAARRGKLDKQLKEGAERRQAELKDLRSKPNERFAVRNFERDLVNKAMRENAERFENLDNPSINEETKNMFSKVSAIDAIYNRGEKPTEQQIKAMQDYKNPADRGKLIAALKQLGKAGGLRSFIAQNGGPERLFQKFALLGFTDQDLRYARDVMNESLKKDGHFDLTMTDDLLDAEAVKHGYAIHTNAEGEKDAAFEMADMNAAQRNKNWQKLTSKQQLQASNQLLFETKVTDAETGNIITKQGGTPWLLDALSGLYVKDKDKRKSRIQTALRDLSTDKQKQLRKILSEDAQFVDQLRLVVRRSMDPEEAQAGKDKEFVEKELLGGLGQKKLDAGGPAGGPLPKTGESTGPGVDDWDAWRQ